ncbi:MAG: pentapeptide repeat-containing protein [Melioribacteraceae bacterium]|jgi:uncharacterized protein YjbI with pentapeptide repeats|nr:pentapeptide repeat-containing protein [Melioribacteraceae bacterium]
MEDLYQLEKTFNKINFTETPISKGEYEKCVFKNCNFFKGNLAEFIFIDCEFISCNLSMIEISSAAFNNAQFIDCKILGVHFETCNDFGFSVRFENCILDHSSFLGIKMNKTNFISCKMEEVDFAESDLTNSVFTDCDLKRAMFNRTNLTKADLSTSYNFSIDPEINKIKRAKFSVNNLSGLLDKYEIVIKN